MAIVKRKRANGLIAYMVRVQDGNGRWYPAKTFLKESEAKAFEESLELKRGQGVASVTDDARTTTLDEYYPVWGANCRSEVSDGWKQSQDQMYRTHVAPVIGKRALAGVSVADVGRVFNRMTDRKLSPQMRLHVYNLIARLFADAKGYFEMDAASPLREQYHRAELGKVEAPFLEPWESVKLLQAARDHYAGTAVWCETLSALRSEAALPLLWGDCLWDASAFRLRRFYKRKVKRIESLSKSAEQPLVAMPPLLRDYLLERRGADHEYVCQGPRGGMLAYGTYLKALTKLCELAGVRRVTPHGLRHSATEIWVEQGATEEDLRRLLNHSSSSSTKRYIHRTDRRVQALASGMRSLTIIEGGAAFTRTVTQVKDSAVFTQKSQEAARS
jgi:integrase